MDVSTILKRIELRRIELSMSKTEFYEKSGISSATYSQWNTNTFQPSKRKLMGAASALKMTYQELVGEETDEEQKNPDPQTGAGMDDLTKDILSELEGMSHAEMLLVKERIQKIKEARE